MSKYQKFQKPTLVRPAPVHPLWRGIGCLMMVIVPVISYAAAMLFVSGGEKRGWPFPPGMMGYVQFPSWVWEAPVLPLLLSPIAHWRNMWAILVVFLIFVVLLTGIFTTLYAVLYRFMGPSRYTPLDARPSKHKARAYKR